MKRARTGDSHARKRFGGGNVHVELDYDQSQQEPEQKSQGGTSGPLDQEYGQRAAFPLDGECSEEVAQYLAMVRKEASERPSFVATKENFKKSASTKMCRNKSEENEQTVESTVGDAKRTTVESTDTDSTIVDKSTDSIRKGDGSEISKTAIGELVASELDSGAATPSKEPYHIDLAKHQEFLTQFLQLRDQPVEAEHLTENSLPGTRKEWRKLIVETDPNPAVIASFSEPLVIMLLGYIHGWISARLPPHLDQWVIALLVRLPDTLIGTDIAVLRGLAKKCYGVRANKKNNELEPHVGELLDKVIGVVADFYCQYDIMPCVRRSNC